MRKLFLACLLAMQLTSEPASAQDIDWRADARTLYGELISMRTAAGQNQGARIAEHLAARFRAGGFAAEDVRVTPYDDTAMLTVRYRGAAGSALRPVLLLAHLDIVDALASDWSLEPFTLTERDGYFYGRGVYDNKIGVLALTMNFLRLRAEGFTPNRDLIIVFTGDEETNGRGAQIAARDYANAEYALNSDSGGGAFATDGRALGFALQTSEKTYATFTLTARNRGGHSSQPRADNAINELSAALTRIAAHRFSPRLSDTTRAYFEHQAIGAPAPLARALRRFARNPRDRAAADLIERDPGFIGATRTTCVATRLAAGHADNALPQTAVATVNCRIFPGVSIEETRAELARVAGDAAIVVELRPDFTPASDPSPLREDVIAAYRNSIHARFPNVDIIPSMSVGATDGAFLRAAGVPVYGVQGAWLVSPDDDRAHGRDERIPVESAFFEIDHWRAMLLELFSAR